jgi:hypothetical protein
LEETEILEIIAETCDINKDKSVTIRPCNRKNPQLPIAIFSFVRYLKYNHGEKSISDYQKRLIDGNQEIISHKNCMQF